MVRNFIEWHDVIFNYFIKYTAIEIKWRQVGNSVVLQSLLFTLHCSLCILYLRYKMLIIQK